MSRRFACIALIASLAGVATSGTVSANGGRNAPASAAPGPAGEGSAAVTHGKLVAGAGGTYLPIAPDTIVPGDTGGRTPIDEPPKGPDPEGESCPVGDVYRIGPGPPGPGGGVVDIISIHPRFVKNASGGYDGFDPAYGYAVANAIPAGGDPLSTAPGSDATAANVAARIIVVDALLIVGGRWADARPVPPYGGSCVGALFSFGAPYIAGVAPAPPPARRVLETPPFPTGPALVAQLTRSWSIGAVETMPGPGPTAPSYVHIPTCAWTRSNVPAAPARFHALASEAAGGYTLFLLYDVTIAPGPVTWAWGDGTTTVAPGPVESGPASVPGYEPSSQRWADPCAVSHAYGSVSAGETITASETFVVTITVSWSDGVAVHTQPVVCDPVSGGACRLAIGPADGWASGPHPIDQIEPVPFEPPGRP